MDWECRCAYLPAMRFVLLTGKGKGLSFNYSITSPMNYRPCKIRCKPCKIKLEQEQQKPQQAHFQRWVQKDPPHPNAKRLPGNKKNGRQEGYVGHTLESVEEPDHIELHKARFNVTK